MVSGFSWKRVEGHFVAIASKSMQYWQFKASRMSRAVQKFERDGEWHRSSATELSWYRVWNNKTIQRANFQNDAEEESLLPLVSALEPLAGITQSTGFREEIRIEEHKRQLFLVIGVGYPLTDPETAAAFERALADAGVRSSVVGGLVTLMVAVSELRQRPLLLAVETGNAARQLFQALSTNRVGKIITDASILAFRRAIESATIADELAQ